MLYEGVAIQGYTNINYYLKEYDDILMGKRRKYSLSVMMRDINGDVCAELLRNIFRRYMNWSPVDIREKLTIEIINNLKITPLIARIPCPPEINSQNELYYIAWHLYPETKNVSDAELVVKLYQDIMSGRIKKFPGSYFEGNEGFLRAKILFMCMIREYIPIFHSNEELYAFFSSPEGRRAIIKYKLSIPLRDLYANPLDYLHDALPQDQKSEELYKFYSDMINSGHRYGRQATNEKSEINGQQIPSIELELFNDNLNDEHKDDNTSEDIDLSGCNVVVLEEDIDEY